MVADLAAKSIADDTLPDHALNESVDDAIDDEAVAIDSNDAAVDDLHIVDAAEETLAYLVATSVVDIGHNRLSENHCLVHLDDAMDSKYASYDDLAAIYLNDSYAAVDAMDVAVALYIDDLKAVVIDCFDDMHHYLVENDDAMHVAVDVDMDYNAVRNYNAQHLDEQDEHAVISEHVMVAVHVVDIAVNLID